MTKSANALSAPQQLILAAASHRRDRMILPLPTTVRAHGGARHRLLASLLSKQAVEEVRTKKPAISWRQDEQGLHYALRLTANAAATIGGGDGAAPSAPDVASVAPQIAPVPHSEPLAATDTATHAVPGGKLGQVLLAVGATQGATVQELMTLTGWLPHTTRSALTRLKQRGFPITLIKNSDRKAYQLCEAGKG